MSSDTPRTDAEQERVRREGICLDDIPVSPDFARTLERELAAVTAENERLANGNNAMEKELPKLRHQLEAERAAHTETARLLYETTAERDAAFRKLDALERSIADLSHPNMRMLLTERDALKADKERLDWLLKHMSGKAARELGMEYSDGLHREHIDAARKEQP